MTDLDDRKQFRNEISDRWGKNTAIGGALLLVSLLFAAAGVIISLRTGNNRYFLALSIPAAVLIVAGGVMVSRDLLAGPSGLLLTAGEQTITAEVLGVTRNLRTAGEKTTYIVICRYRDPVTGREETFSSRELDEYPGKEVIGRKVTVHVDTSEKGKYTVEIDALLDELSAEKAKETEKKTEDESSKETENNEQADGLHQ